MISPQFRSAMAQRAMQPPQPNVMTVFQMLPEAIKQRISMEIGQPAQSSQPIAAPPSIAPDTVAPQPFVFTPIAAPKQETVQPDEIEKMYLAQAKVIRDSMDARNKRAQELSDSAASERGQAKDHSLTAESLINQAGNVQAKQTGGPNLKTVGIALLAQLLASAMGDDGSLSKGMVRGYMGAKDSEQQRQNSIAEQERSRLMNLAALARERAQGADQNADRLNTQVTQMGNADVNSNLSLGQTLQAAESSKQTLAYKQSLADQKRAQDAQRGYEANLKNLGKITTDTGFDGWAAAQNANLDAMGMAPMTPEQIAGARAQWKTERQNAENKKTASDLLTKGVQSIYSGGAVTRKVGEQFIRRAMQLNPNLIGENPQFAETFNKVLSGVGTPRPDEVLKDYMVEIAGKTKDYKIQQEALKVQKLLKDIQNVGRSGGGKASGKGSIKEALDAASKFLIRVKPTSNAAGIIDPSTMDNYKAAQQALSDMASSGFGTPEQTLKKLSEAYNTGKKTPGSTPNTSAPQGGDKYLKPATG